MLLSLAGIPLTAGFLGKFLVVAAGVGSALWFLVIILIINTAVGLFYYLRVIVALYMDPVAGKAEVTPSVSAPLSMAGGIVLAVLTLLLVWLGIFPAPFIQFVSSAASSLF